MARLSSRARTPRFLLENLEDRTVLSGSPIGNLVVFGDSLSDVGNISSYLALIGAPSPFDTTPPGAYFTTTPAGLPQTRFTGGPNWAETLAEAVGEAPLVPSVLGGLDFSWGGASLSADPIFPGVPSVGAQVGEYLAGHDPAEDDLFAFWAGANDFFSSSQSSPTGTPIDPALPAFELADQVMALADEGARLFVINELPPIGGVPYFQDLLELGFIDDATIAGINAWSAGFNAYLAAGLAGVQAVYTDAVIVTVDVDGLFTQWAAPDNAPGFTNWTDAVGPYNTDPGSGGLLTGVTATDPAEFLFFDSVHPGAKAHSLLGLNAAAGVLSALGENHLKVTNTTDAIDPLDGGRSLREALAVADLMPGEQKITFSLGKGHKTITLGGELDINDDVKIVGGKITIDAAGNGRIFDVAEGADVSLSLLRLVGGNADQGGAIRNAGDLSLTGVVLSGNEASEGGAIYNTGTLHVVASEIVHNTASGDTASGGGIANVGATADATLIGVLIACNKATGTLATGGGIANTGGASLTVTACLVLDNTADGGAGGQGHGGGIYIDGTSTAKVRASLISGNAALGDEGLGGGVYVGAGGVYDVKSTLNLGNFASTKGKNTHRA